jgi:hypothetical protein
MSIGTIIPEVLGGQPLIEPQTGAAGDQKYIKPNGAKHVYIVCHVVMGDVADVVLIPKTSSSAAGANLAVLSANVPIYVNTAGVWAKKTAAANYTVSDASGEFIVVFCIPASLIPTADYYIGISMAASHANNLVSAIAYCDYYHSVSA